MLSWREEDTSFKNQPQTFERYVAYMNKFGLITNKPKYNVKEMLYQTDIT